METQIFRLQRIAFLRHVIIRAMDIPIVWMHNDIIFFATYFKKFYFFSFGNVRRKYFMRSLV